MSGTKVILYSTSLRTWEVWSGGRPIGHGTLQACQNHSPALPVSERQLKLEAADIARHAPRTIHRKDRTMTTTRTVLIAIDVDDPQPGFDHEAASNDDLLHGLAARLDEFYPTANGYPWQPYNLRLAVTTVAGSHAVISGANVALDGADEATTGFPEAALDEGAAAAEALAKCYECGMRSGVHAPACRNGDPS